ncbi:restriction endonuclease subunit S [Brevibacillus laterosporus]|uniref:restriction endonuclease subunit S n=1 Tax=Brevibacillus laterosporus TaxID=1465 RepID=UPI002405CEF0|nr:restriction endonuclease subunit S [Brevibacillus laterosporus]MDF9412272.1 restriction endonuclease subunit S [Brevibacillus laterosporus]
MKNKRTPDIRFSGFSEEWEVRMLGDLVIDVSRPMKMVDDDIYQLVTVKRRNGGIVSRGIFKGSEVLVKSQFIVKSGDYLISKRQVVHGANGIVPDYLDGSIVSNEYLVLHGTKDLSIDFFSLISELPSMYRNFFLSSYGIDIEKLVFNFSDWKKRKIFIPSISEQHKITSFFEVINNAITLHQQELTALKQTKQGFLQKMFPKEGESVPEVRFPGFTGDWEERKLGEMSESFEYGLNASATKYDGKNKYIRITDIDDNTHEFIEDNLTSPNIDVSSAENYLVKEGDILFARTGASVGKSYIYDNKDGKVYYAGFLIRARIKSGYDPRFIFQNTLTTKYSEFIKITSQRSGQPGVNAQEYANFSIMVPNNEEQTKIGNFFKLLDDTIALHQRELDALKETKKAFLQKMFV